MWGALGPGLMGLGLRMALVILLVFIDVHCASGPLQYYYLIHYLELEDHIITSEDVGR